MAEGVDPSYEDDYGYEDDYDEDNYGQTKDENIKMEKFDGWEQTKDGLQNHQKRKRNLLIYLEHLILWCL